MFEDDGYHFRSWRWGALFYLLAGLFIAGLIWVPWVALASGIIMIIIILVWGVTVMAVMYKEYMPEPVKHLLTSRAQKPKDKPFEPARNINRLQAEEDFKHVIADTKKLESLYKQGELSKDTVAKFEDGIHQIARKYNDDSSFDPYRYSLFEQQALIGYMSGDKVSFNKFHQLAVDKKPKGAQFASERAKDWGGDHIVEEVRKAKSSRLRRFLKAS